MLGEVGRFHLLLRLGDVVGHPVSLNSGRGAVVDCVTGAGVPVPGLSDATGVNDPAFVSQGDGLVNREVGELRIKRISLDFATDKRNVRVADKTIFGLQESQSSAS